MKRRMLQERGAVPAPTRRRQAGVARITVSIPQDAYQLGEKERLSQGLTRSEFVRRLYRDHLDRIERERRIERYAAAYAEHPEADDDEWAGDHSAALLFADNTIDHPSDSQG